MRRYLASYLFPELQAGYENPWTTRPFIVRRNRSPRTALSALEICAGAGGQALGLESAGIQHHTLVELDRHACATLRANRPQWNVAECDLNKFDGAGLRGIDIVAGGLPCPPFSIAGKQLGESDERNLFPAMLRIVEQTAPSAVLIENVRGILDAVFTDYRKSVGNALKKMNYEVGWKLMNASDFGVPQLRPRVVFVALRKEFAHQFSWPEPLSVPPPTVGEALYDLVAANGWKNARAWRERADEIAPTIVGGSLKHGGPDLGPTRARAAWATLGVDGKGIADAAPAPDFEGMPRLTVRMVARLQGFPDVWQFVGSKTQTYRQVGNAFPPPFAAALGHSLVKCLVSVRKRRRTA